MRLPPTWISISSWMNGTLRQIERLFGPRSRGLVTWENRELHVYFKIQNTTRKEESLACLQSTGKHPGWPLGLVSGILSSCGSLVRRMQLHQPCTVPTTSATPWRFFLPSCDAFGFKCNFRWRERFQRLILAISLRPDARDRAWKRAETCSQLHHLPHPSCAPETSASANQRHVLKLHKVHGLTALHDQTTLRSLRKGALTDQTVLCLSSSSCMHHGSCLSAPQAVQLHDLSVCCITIPDQVAESVPCSQLPCHLLYLTMEDATLWCS